MFPVGACQCIQDAVSFADSVGHLYAVFVMKRRYRYTPSILGLRTSSESAILIVGRVLACAGSGVNNGTDDFGADINSEFYHKNRDISIK